MRLTQREAEVKLRYYQRVFRIQDWDVKVFIVRRRDLPEGAAASCQTWPTLKEATIKLMDPVDWDPDDPRDMERDLIHEAVHVLMDGFTRNLQEGTEEYNHMEVAVQMVANGVIGLQRQLDGYRVEERSKRRGDAT